MRSLLAPASTGVYLELGVGVGADALQLGAKVIGVDSSRLMCQEARRRGLELVLQADACAIPVRSAAVDGCWSDRTFQHLINPRAALSELVRVTKPGAPVVVVDPDYGTQTLTFPDPNLARKVLDFRAQHALRNGTLAHRMAGLFTDSGMDQVTTEERTLVVRNPSAVDNVLGLRSWAASAAARQFLTAAEVNAWETLYDRVVTEGSFYWSVGFFITSGRVRSS